MALYDLPGIEFQSQKGDLWEFSLPSCITLHIISRVSVVANGDNGWNIGAIVTLVQDVDDNIQLLTQDFGVDAWINDGALENFRLTPSDGINSGSYTTVFDKPRGSVHVPSIYSILWVSPHLFLSTSIITHNFYWFSRFLFV
jgi:hypothetical protein